MSLNHALLCGVHSCVHASLRRHGAKEAYTLYALLSYGRRYWRKATKRATKTPEARRLMDVMTSNPAKARPKKGENKASDNQNALTNDEDEVEFLREVPASSRKGQEADELEFVVEYVFPRGAYLPERF